MRLTLVAVGRLRGEPLAEAFSEYARRLAAARWPVDVIEVEEKRKLSGAELMAREGALLLAAVPAGSHVIALDARGKPLSSEAFASALGRLNDAGRAVTFLIGGADGFAPAVREAADQMLSFGSMTWPHKLVRVLLAEQLFRAQSILAGHPYHRA
ncbi:MAG: 23S rRNA (pseudouridine(1915)-N(3))-methyltransferase RlmH [Alphaproteobacteria bacterium]|nr:23S rRNA (pseudouridine(1915)-N(3))-methyltransferase RlmH [Alphaproteobacteria bacterium]